MPSRARHAPFSRSYDELIGFARKHRRNPTRAEGFLWLRLNGRPSASNLGVRCRQQALICGYIADFYVPAWRLIIEVDGGFHDRRGNYDQRRDEWLKENGYRVIRFSNARVLNDIDGVLAEIRWHGGTL